VKHERANCEKGFKRGSYNMTLKDKFVPHGRKIPTKCNNTNHVIFSTPCKEAKSKRLCHKFQ
jgi:hypothetical protein